METSKNVHREREDNMAEKETLFLRLAHTADLYPDYGAGVCASGELRKPVSQKPVTEDLGFTRSGYALVSTIAA